MCTGQPALQKRDNQVYPGHETDVNAVERGRIQTGVLVRGGTALIYAAEAGHADVVRMLIDAHNARWGHDNGYSHLRSALVGAARSFPVAGRRVDISTWQQIVLCDFDDRPRRVAIRCA